MKANIAYKFELMPTREQERIFAQAVGCRRFVWNKAIELQKRCLEQAVPFLKYTELAGRLMLWKKEVLRRLNHFRGIPHPMRSVGWGWIAGRASARQFLPLNIPLYDSIEVSDRNSVIAIGPESISPKKWSNGFCMCLANRSSGRRFDAVDKIGNRIARRNGNQEVDVISLSGKIENPNLKSIQNAV